MHLEPIEHGLILSAPSEGYVRSPGLHMSDLYGSLYKHLNPKRYDKRDAEGNSLPFDELRMELGSAFEEALEPVLRQRLVGTERPGEFVTQHAAYCPKRITTVVIGDAPCFCGAGVIYSPDHFLFNGVFRLGEFKLTWMTIASGLRDRKFDKWFCQKKVYCHHLDTPHARLYAYFVNGHGKWEWYKVPDVWNPNHPEGLCPPGPLLLAWDIEFTQKELDNEWSVLVRHGRKVGLIPCS